MVNKRQFKISNDKKVLHKIGKHWVIISAMALALLGGVSYSGVLTHNNVYAANLAPSESVTSSNKTQTTSLSNNPSSNQAKSTKSGSSVVNSTSNNTSSNSIGEKASDFHSTLVGNAMQKGVHTLGSMRKNGSKEAKTTNSNSPKNVTVTFHYVDENGHSIASDDVFHGVAGKGFQFHYKNIPNYSIDYSKTNEDHMITNAKFPTSDWVSTLIYGPFPATHATDPAGQNNSINIAPYYGLTGKFVPATKTLEFTGGTLNWSYGTSKIQGPWDLISDTPFMGLYSDDSSDFYSAPKNLKSSDIQHVQFDNGVKVSNNVSDLNCMFYNNPYIKSVTGLSNLTNNHIDDLEDLFYNDTNLSDIEGLSDWNTYGVTSIAHMFEYDNQLNPDTYNELSNWRFNSDIPDKGMVYKTNLHKGKKPTLQSDNDGKYVFYKLPDEPVTSGNVTDTFSYEYNGKLVGTQKESGSKSSNFMVTAPSDYSFVDNNGNPELSPIVSLGNGNKTFNVAPMYDGLIYKYNKANNSIEFTGGTAQSDLSNFIPNANSDIRNASTISFDNNIDMSHVTNMNSMFRKARNLSHLDFGNSFDTNNVLDMSDMFSKDYKLTSLILPNSFNTTKAVNNMYSTEHMFSRDKNLKSIIIKSPNTKFSMSDIKPMYMQLQTKDKNGKYYTNSYSNDFAKGLTGTFVSQENPTPKPTSESQGHIDVEFGIMNNNHFTPLDANNVSSSDKSISVHKGNDGVNILSDVAPINSDTDYNGSTFALDATASPYIPKGYVLQSNTNGLAHYDLHDNIVYPKDVENDIAWTDTKNGVKDYGIRFIKNNNNNTQLIKIAVKRNVNGSITTHYVDNNNNKLASDTITIGLNGNPYSLNNSKTLSKKVDGYTYSYKYNPKESRNINIKNYNTGNQSIKLVYDLVPQKVSDYINYVDSNNKVIASPFKVFGENTQNDMKAAYMANTILSSVLDAKNNVNQMVNNLQKWAYLPNNYVLTPQGIDAIRNNFILKSINSSNNNDYYPYGSLHLSIPVKYVQPKPAKKNGNIDIKFVTPTSYGDVPDVQVNGQNYSYIDDNNVQDDMNFDNLQDGSQIHLSDYNSNAKIGADRYTSYLNPKYELLNPHTQKVTNKLSNSIMNLQNEGDYDIIGGKSQYLYALAVPKQNQYNITIKDAITGSDITNYTKAGNNTDLVNTIHTLMNSMNSTKLNNGDYIIKSSSKGNNAIEYLVPGDSIQNAPEIANTHDITDNADGEYGSYGNRLDLNNVLKDVKNHIKHYPYSDFNEIIYVQPLNHIFIKFEKSDGSVLKPARQNEPDTALHALPNNTLSDEGIVGSPTDIDGNTFDINTVLSTNADGYLNGFVPTGYNVSRLGKDNNYHMDLADNISNASQLTDSELKASTLYYAKNPYTVVFKLQHNPTITVYFKDKDTGKEINNTTPAMITEKPGTPFNINNYKLPSNYQLVVRNNVINRFGQSDHSIDIIGEPKQGTININYIDDKTNKAIPNSEITKVAPENTNFDYATYNMPSGYQFNHVVNNVNKFNDSTQTISVYVDKISTVNVRFVNASDNNRSVHSDIADSDIVGSKFDINNYLSAVPQSYYITNIAPNIKTFSEEPQEVTVFVKPKLSNIVINYLDAKTKSHVKAPMKLEAPVGSSFDVYNYLNVPNNYEYSGINGEVSNFSNQNGATSNINVLLMKEPVPKVAKSTITVNYVDAKTNKLISKAGSDTEEITTPFDVSKYTKNLPKGYKYNGIENNITSFDYDNHTVSILLNKVVPVQSTTIFINYRDKNTGQIIKSDKVSGNVGSAFDNDYYNNNLPDNYVINNIDGNTNIFKSVNQSVDIYISAKPQPRPIVQNSTIDIKYIDAKTGQDISDSLPITKPVGTKFNINDYINIPNGYLNNSTRNRDISDIKAFGNNNQIVNIYVDAKQAPKPTPAPKPVIQNGTISIEYVDAQTGQIISNGSSITKSAGTNYDVNDYMNVPNGYSLNNIKDNISKFDNSDHVIEVLVNKKAPASKASSNTSMSDIPFGSLDFNFLSDFMSKASSASSSSTNSASASQSVRPSSASNQQYTNLHYPISYGRNVSEPDKVTYKNKKYNVYYHMSGKNTIYVPINKHHNHTKKSHQILVSTNLPVPEASSDSLVRMVDRINFNKHVTKRVKSLKQLTKAIESIKAGQIVDYKGNKMSKVNISNHWRYFMINKNVLAHKVILSVGSGTKKDLINMLRTNHEITCFIKHIAVVHGKHANYIRYEFSYKGHNFWLTGKDSYVPNAYWQKSELSNSAKKLRVLNPCYEYSSPKYSKKTYRKTVYRGQILHIKRIIFINKPSYQQTRFQLTNGRYVTSNKNWVKLLKK